MAVSARTALFLYHLPRVGRVRLRTFLARLAAPGAQSIEPPQAVSLLGLAGLSETVVESAIAMSDALLQRCQALEVQVHPFGSRSSYPPQLARLANPPAVLFSRGRFDPNRTPRVAVIGTRKPTPWGRRTAAACVAEVRCHGVVVSGLALGIDPAAQAASVEHHGATWVVVAHGLHTISPASNRELAQTILRLGAWISEYPPGEPARRHYFVERDRIQAGLADAVLVIESGLHGGAMHTVRFAQQAGVPVWVTVPRTCDGMRNARDVPESQQGTWELLRSRRATRVKAAAALRQMVHALGKGDATPSGLFAS